MADPAGSSETDNAGSTGGSLPQLGRLERCELRDIWMSEAADFTPWLARPENLVALGEALGLQLELEAQEKTVGPFRADILCKDVDTDHWVLIENQLERTDHTHLGQLLTYASGLEAVTIIWVAARFTEEHRSTLDWLNKITDERFRFFGLEVELWRIGTSSPAPKFNVVSKPNNWSQSVAQAAKAIDDSELTEVRLLQRDYWTALLPRLDTARGPVKGNKKPQPRSWMQFAIGRAKIHIASVMVRPRNQIQVELYLKGIHAKARYRMLRAQRPTIEKELGYSLIWEELPEGQDSRIFVALDANPEDESDWPRQHDWLVARLNQLYRVFVDRVAALDLES